MPGVYVHVPFCQSICHYCDFNRVLDDDPDLKGRYVRALLAEIETVAGEREDWPEFESLFVGGGTPTTLAAADLAAVVRAVRIALPFAADAEVTVEANPETVTVPYMAELAAAGVDRISMGAQSFAPPVLEFLGRRHDADRPLRAIAQVREAGIARISLDLIYGAPGETTADWERSLRTAIDAQLDHVSAYALTVEANTPYAAMVRADPRLAPDDDVQAERMALADELLGAAGMERYEVSNWAVPGQECRHNLVYWRGGDWLAVGAGAHGAWEDRRWWNLRAPGGYADAVLGGRGAIAGEERLDAEARRAERLMMGLRLAEGVLRADVEPLDETRVERLVDHGLLAAEAERLAVTGAGRALTGAIVVELASA